MARIGINASLLTFAQSYRNAGTAAYIYHLLQSLPTIPSEHRYIIFTNADRAQLLAARTPRYHLVGSVLDTERPSRRIFWEQTLLPALIARERLDLIHGTLNVLPLARRIPGIVTIHDVAFLRFPERFLPAKRRYLTLLTGLSARGARLVVASSENTKRDLVQLMGVDEARVRVVYLGVDDRLRRSPDAAAVAELRERYALPEQFFLFIGTLEPRKNLVRLIDAYAQARKSGLEWPLVLAGGKGWLYQEIFNRVQELGLQEQVRFPGYVLYDDLPLWYNAAGAFVYPSLYEGFGLPVAEAMACGCPVLTTRHSSLPEVAGDAAILVNGEDVGALAHGLIALAGDTALRVSLAARGKRQSGRFDWRRTAAEMVAIYDEALREA